MEMKPGRLLILITVIVCGKGEYWILEVKKDTKLTQLSNKKSRGISTDSQLEKQTYVVNDRRCLQSFGTGLKDLPR